MKFIRKKKYLAAIWEMMDFSNTVSWAASIEKSSSMSKCANSYHPAHAQSIIRAFAFHLKHSMVFNYSVSGQRKP